MTRTAAALLLAVALPAAAGPDLTVAGLPNIANWGGVGGLRAYSFGTILCNTGNAELDFVSNTNRHPVLASQLYRLSNGRFEQIGLGLVKHEFFPLQMNQCGTCTPPSVSSRLGVGCSTTDSASIAGSQSVLGPRTEVDPATGVFLYPFTGINQSGDAVFKRLRASEADLSVPGARYFFESVAVAPDDAASGNGANNAAWREVTINPATFNAAFTGNAAPEQPALFAWQGADPEVLLTSVIAPDGGVYWVGSRATPIGGGQWAYEYAVMNLNSADPAEGVSVPAPGAAVSGVGFHDVDYHSGDPVDGTDWAGQAAGGEVAWSAPAPGPGLLPNALRWGTLYNFRFVAGTQSVHADMRITLAGGGVLALSVVAPDSPACGPADLVSPFGVLDLLDVQAFIAGFVGADPVADLADPFGVFDLADLQAFVGAFNAGCP